LCAEDRVPNSAPAVQEARAQYVGGRLQRSDIVDRQEGVVVLAESDLRAGEFLLDEAATVQIVSGFEGVERARTHQHLTENLIADVEVVVGVSAALAQAVMRVL